MAAFCLVHTRSCRPRLHIDILFSCRACLYVSVFYRRSNRPLPSLCEVTSVFGLQNTLPQCHKTKVSERETSSVLACLLPCCSSVSFYLDFLSLSLDSCFFVFLVQIDTMTFCLQLYGLGLNGSSFAIPNSKEAGYICRMFYGSFFAIPNSKEAGYIGRMFYLLNLYVVHA